MKSIFKIFVILFLTFPLQSLAQFEKYYNFENVPSGDGLWIIALPILIIIFAFGGAEARKAFGFFGVVLILLGVWAKASLYLGGLFMPFKNGVNIAGLLIFVIGWFGGIYLWQLEKKTNENKQQSDIKKKQADVESKEFIVFSVIRREWAEVNGEARVALLFIAIFLAIMYILGYLA